MGGFDYYGVRIELNEEGFLANQTAPMVRAICRTIGMALKQDYELFPSGPADGACNVAGLPKPDGCV